MAGAYLRELFYNYTEDTLPSIYRADIDQHIDILLRTEQITNRHIVVARLYSAGFTVFELTQRVPNAEDLLVQFFSLLSESMQYDDEVVLNIWLNSNVGSAQERRYQRSQKLKTADAWREKIEIHSRAFE